MKAVVVAAMSIAGVARGESVECVTLGSLVQGEGDLVALDGGGRLRRDTEASGTGASVWEFEVPPAPRWTTRECQAPCRLDEGFSEVVAGDRRVLAFVAPPGGLDAAQREAMRDHTRQAARKRQETAKTQAAWMAARAAAAGNWTALHPELRDWGDGQWLHPTLLTRVNAGAAEPVAGTGGSVFLIRDIFSPRFLQLLREELEHAARGPNGHRWTRPNTMNRYGFMLEELGLRPLLDGLLAHVLEPLRQHLLPDYGPLDSHHAFTIRYEQAGGRLAGEEQPGPRGDVKLDRHMDLAEVTLNVCLWRSIELEGGQVFFEGPMGDELPRVALRHPENAAVLHVGQLWHGSEPLTLGWRENLVLWSRSTTFRSSPFENFARECPAELEAILGAPSPLLAREHLEL